MEKYIIDRIKQFASEIGGKCGKMYNQYGIKVKDDVVLLIRPYQPNLWDIERARTFGFEIPTWYELFWDYNHSEGAMHFENEKELDTIIKIIKGEGNDSK